tara:strand:+ start:85 stop:1563 length:1479 start_codon:yes stop_codon:yes gene_type:complete
MPRRLALLPLALLGGARANTLPPRSAAALALKAQAQPAHWFSQQLDHFNANDTRSFDQRYYLDETHFRAPDGPVFLYVSGEAPLYGAPAAGSSIGELAAEHGALVVAVEHRYYGDSLPFTYLDLDNLAYLNSGQALLDLAAVHSFVTAQLRDRHGASGRNTWVAFGGSYAGALATWFRVKFPSLVHGVVASSATLEARASYEAFDAQLGHTVGPACADALRRAMLQLDELLARPEHAAAAKRAFEADALQDGDLRLLLGDAHSMAVQYGYKELICEPMAAAEREGRDLVMALANYTTSFFYPTLEQGGSREYATEYLATLTVDPSTTGRQWRYQQCAELGWFANAAPVNPVRSPLLNEAYQRAACEAIFGAGVWPDTESVNRHYGGKQPQVTNAFFTHGVEDPWQHAGVRQSLGPSAPARIAECAGCSHCVDLRHVSDDDPQPLKTIRAEIGVHVRRWLEEAAPSTRGPWRGSLQEQPAALQSAPFFSLAAR